MLSPVYRAVEMLSQEIAHGATETADKDAATCEAGDPAEERTAPWLDTFEELCALVQDADILPEEPAYLVALVRQLDPNGWVVGSLDLETPLAALA